jgi:hypothetical protein
MRDTSVMRFVVASEPGLPIYRAGNVAGLRID